MGHGRPDNMNRVEGRSEEKLGSQLRARLATQGPAWRADFIEKRRSSLENALLKANRSFHGLWGAKVDACSCLFHFGIGIRR